MALEDRDWFRDGKLLDEAGAPVDEPPRWRLTDDGHGYRVEPEPPRFPITWGDVALWFVILVIVRLYTG